VRHVIDVVLVDECSVDDARSIRDDFVHPTTMSDCFAAFCIVHNTLELIVLDLFTPTRRWPFGNESFAWRNCKESLRCKPWFKQKTLPKMERIVHALERGAELVTHV
jgi:hypothetical protein